MMRRGQHRLCPVRAVRLGVAAWALTLAHSSVAPCDASRDVSPRVAPLHSRVDGVYGRFEGDLDAGLGLGVSQLADSTAFELRTSLHYFSTAGLWFGAGLPLDAPEAGNTGTSLAFGIDVRPAFLPRFSENMQQGPAVLDLTLDSISLSMGAFFDLVDQGEPSRGLELSFGTGVPLTGRAQGLWLEARAIGRFPDGGDTRLGGVALLSWHTLFGSPLTNNP